jgi:hypothetical protein
LLETRNKTLKQEAKAFISPPGLTRCIWSDWTVQRSQKLLASYPEAEFITIRVKCLVGKPDIPDPLSR